MGGTLYRMKNIKTIDHAVTIYINSCTGIELKPIVEKLQSIYTDVKFVDTSDAVKPEAWVDGQTSTHSQLVTTCKPNNNKVIYIFKDLQDDKFKNWNICDFGKYKYEVLFIKYEELNCRYTSSIINNFVQSTSSIKTKLSEAIYFDNIEHAPPQRSTVEYNQLPSVFLNEFNVNKLFTITGDMGLTDSIIQYHRLYSLFRYFGYNITTCKTIKNYHSPKLLTFKNFYPYLTDIEFSHKEKNMFNCINTLFDDLFINNKPINCFNLNWRDADKEPLKCIGIDNITSEDMSSAKIHINIYKQLESINLLDYALFYPTGKVAHDLLFHFRRNDLVDIKSNPTYPHNIRPIPSIYKYIDTLITKELIHEGQEFNVDILSDGYPHLQEHNPDVYKKLIEDTEYMITPPVSEFTYKGVKFTVTDTCIGNTEADEQKMYDWFSTKLYNHTVTCASGYMSLNDILSFTRNVIHCTYE
jgi:hypothetical protein